MASKVDVDHKTSNPHVAHSGTNAFVGIDKDTFEEDIWLIALLTTIIIILVLLSCSLRSTTHYLQESYLITRAKEWVQFPLSREQQQQQEQQQSSLLSAEAGVATDGPNNDATSSVGSQPDGGDFCSWESETSQTGGGAGNFEDAQEAVMKSSHSLDVDLCQRRGNALLLLNDGMTALSLAPGQSPLAAATPPPVAVSSSTSSPQLTSKTSAQFFVFGGGASDLTSQLPLTKSESLDENRRTNRESIGREKCFKANRSVDEILGSTHQGLGSSSSSSSASCTPKCRKLQERRGSNHSLTIAVKVTDAMAILPTVTTPRECSASQFLLTAGNTMTRRQLRTCLKDVNSIHAEFWSIPTNVPEAVEQDPGAFRKNRYRYVLPNPHSRVRLPLPTVDAAPTDDTTNGTAAIGGYINANYIRDLNGEAKAYIATQGPLSNTIDDFWLMIWSERSPAIVMITKLVESGKAKCESYLPPSSASSSTRYGDIKVSVESIEETAGCSVRHLLLERDDGGEEKGVHRVLHYWYTDWPDHKTPDNPRTLVDLAATIESLRRGQSSLLLPSSPSSQNLSSSSCGFAAGPIVVHCSAGVGRTGCFIALCHALSQLVTESRVDILGIVCALRCDRGGMVQTAEQYEFLHRALVLYEKSTLSDYDGGCD